MEKKNCVFIATSLDGFIADKSGGIDWLHSIPNPDNDDMGYAAFIKNIDGIVMGRNTFQTVCGFDVDWPYQVPIFVLSNSLQEIPETHKDKAHLVNGPLTNILDQIHSNGFYNLYIDGGSTIQNFLKEDLIDEICITVIPVLLGGGSPLFSDLPKTLDFELIKSKIYLNQVSQNHYRRKKI